MLLLDSTRRTLLLRGMRNFTESEKRCRKCCPTNDINWTLTNWLTKLFSMEISEPLRCWNWIKRFWCSCFLVFFSEKNLKGFEKTKSNFNWSFQLYTFPSKSNVMFFYGASSLLALMLMRYWDFAAALNILNFQKLN